MNTVKKEDAIKKIILKSEQLQYSYKLFRVKVDNFEDISTVKEHIVGIMNDYLEKNRGYHFHFYIV